MKKELTKREKEVLKLISEGLTSEEIAKELKISQRTVDAHRANAMQRIGANNSAHLVAMSITHGWVNRPTYHYDCEGTPITEGDTVEYYPNPDDHSEARRTGTINMGNFEFVLDDTVIPLKALLGGYGSWKNKPDYGLKVVNH